MKSKYGCDAKCDACVIVVGAVVTRMDGVSESEFAAMRGLLLRYGQWWSMLVIMMISGKGEGGSLVC